MRAVSFSALPEAESSGSSRDAVLSLCLFFEQEIAAIGIFLGMRVLSIRPQLG